MRKVVLYIAMSLDGYIADTQGGIDWLELSVDEPEIDTSYADFYKDVDSVIMGRKTYDQVTQVLSPEHYPYEGTTSYIFTHEKRMSSETVKFINEDVSHYVAAMKKKSGRDIWIVGGSTIINPLVNSNLIDVYKVAIVPIILSDGIPLFNPSEQSINLVVKKSYLKNQLTYLHLEKP